MKQKIYLQLEDGSIYEGYTFGAPLLHHVIAEVVFTTVMLKLSLTQVITDRWLCKHSHLLVTMV